MTALQPKYSNNSLYQLLSSTTFEPLKPYIQQNHQLVTVQANESLNAAFAKLVSSNIHSVPVYDPAAHKYIGLLDIRDFSSCLLLSMGGTLGPSFPWNCKDLNSLSEYRPFLHVDSKTSIMNVLLNDLYSSGAHSLPISQDNDPNNLIGMASQSSLIRWLVDQDPKLLGAEFNKPLHEIKQGPIGNFAPVLSVETDSPLLNVIDMLVQNKVSGCAVVDSEGILVGNISTSDLAVVSEEDNLRFLHHPVQTYLSTFGLAQPVTCTVDDSLLDIMKRVSEERIHRIYCITDHKRTPYSVITLSDILHVVTNIATKIESPLMS